MKYFLILFLTVMCSLMHGQTTTYDIFSLPGTIDYSGDVYHNSAHYTKYEIEIPGGGDISFNVSAQIRGNNVDGLEIYDIHSDGSVTLLLMVGFTDAGTYMLYYEHVLESSDTDPFLQYSDGSFSGTVNTSSGSGKALIMLYTDHLTTPTLNGVLINYSAVGQGEEVEEITTVPGQFSFAGEDYTDFIHKNYLITTGQTQNLYFTCNVNIDDESYDYLEIYEYDQDDNEYLLTSIGKEDNANQTTLNYIEQLKTNYPTGKARVVIHTDASGSNSDWETSSGNELAWGGFDVFYSTKPAVVFKHDLAGNRIVRTISTITISAKGASLAGPRLGEETESYAKKDEGFDDKIEDFDLKIYPNPVQETLNLLIQNALGDEQFTYRIFSSQGKLLIEGKVTNEVIENISFSEYASGSYILHIYSQGKSFPFKIIKQ